MKRLENCFLQLLRGRLKLDCGDAVDVGWEVVVVAQQFDVSSPIVSFFLSFRGSLTTRPVWQLIFPVELGRFLP